MSDRPFRELFANGGGIAHVEELESQRAHFLTPSASIPSKAA